MLITGLIIAAFYLVAVLDISYSRSGMLDDPPDLTTGGTDPSMSDIPRRRPT
jgi:hypothetical protein